MWQTVMGVTESKSSPRHLNFTKQLKKTTEVLPLLIVLVLVISGHPTSAPQYSNSSSEHSLFSFFSFFTKKIKNGTCVKKLSKGATACLFHLPIQAFVAAIMKLKARAGIIFRNCEKSNGGNPQNR